MKIEILNEIPMKNRPRNEIQVAATFMHGDADMYSTEVEKFECHKESITPVNMVDFQMIMRGLIAMQSEGFPEYNHRAAEAIIDNLLGEDADGFKDVFFVTDKTSEGNYAILDKVKITYFDNNGREFEVKVTV